MNEDLYLSNSSLVTAVHQHCLQRALAVRDNGTQFVDRLLLSLIVHCSKVEDHKRAMEVLNTAFTCT